MRIRLLGGILILLTTLGCGRQNRYEITSPPLAMVATDGEAWSVRVVPCPYFEYPQYTAIDGQGHLFMASRDHNVFRCLEDGYRALPDLPASISRVSYLAFDPQGNLWLWARYDGPIWRYDGQTWQSFATPVGLGNIDGLFCDGEGRPHIWQESGSLLVMEEDGTWTVELSPAEVDLACAWQGPTPGSVALMGSRLELILPTESGWSIGEPLLEEAPQYVQNLTTDADGRWAVNYTNGGDSHLLVDEGAGPVEVPSQSGTRRLFWWNGILHSYSSYEGELARLEGESWFILQTIEQGAGYLSRSHTLVGPDGVYLVFNGGETWFFDGETLAPLYPNLNSSRGATVVDGQAHLLTYSGRHLVLDDGLWRVLGQPLADAGNLEDVEGLMPAPGGVLLLGEEFSCLWHEESGYQPLLQEDSFQQAYAQADGSVMIVGSNRLWHFTAAEFEDVGPAPLSHYNLRTVCRTADGRVYLAHADKVELMENGTLRTLKIYPDNGVLGMVEWPGQGLYAFGEERFFSVDADEFEDLTPIWVINDNFYPTHLLDGVDDGRGGLLALDLTSDSILRLEAGHWEQVNSHGWYDVDYSGALERTSEGIIFWHDYEHLWLIEEGGS